MEKSQPFKKWVSITAVIGFVIFLADLFFFTDITQVESAIAGANIPVYALAFLAVIASTAFDALSWRAILTSLGERVGFWRVFELTWVGQFLDILIPGGLAGDLSKTYILSKDDGIDGARATAAIVTKDALDLFFALGSVIAGLVLLLSFYSVDVVLVIAIAVTFLFLSLPIALIIVLSVNMRAMMKLVNAALKIVFKIKGEQTGRSVQDKIEGQLREFHDGIASIRQNPKGMIMPAFYESIAELLNIVVLLFVFYALGILIGFEKVFVTNIIVSNLQGQGVMLAGFSELVSVTLYGVLGISPGLRVASSLLAGFAGFWFRLIVSFGYFELVAAEKCVPFFCRKCGGWRSMRKKSCDD